MSYGFEHDKFYIDFEACGRKVNSPREEFTIRARKLFNECKNPILAFSGGTDSQTTLLAFKDQSLDIPCAFMHMPGYNDNEYHNVIQCEKRYGIDLIIVRIDPYEIKNEVLELSQQIDIPPNQIIHSKFLSKLPQDCTLIQAFNGPDPYVKDNKFYLFESANSVEYTRLRAMQRLNIQPVYGFEKDSCVLASVMKDDAVQGALHAWDYFNIEGLTYLDEDPISVINYWDLFIKPTFYGKNWKHDIIHFPKYQGCEKIDYVINGPLNRYRENNMFIPWYDLVDFLENGSGTKRYWQRN